MGSDERLHPAVKLIRCPHVARSEELDQLGFGAWTLFAHGDPLLGKTPLACFSSRRADASAAGSGPAVVGGQSAARASGGLLRPLFPAWLGSSAGPGSSAWLGSGSGARRLATCLRALNSLVVIVASRTRSARAA